MSLKSLLMPAISQRLLSRERLLRHRAAAEKARAARREPHRVHCFHQVDDPYSALLAGVLPQLLQRYDIALVPHVVGPPPDSAAPEREKLVAYSRRDAELLAHHHGLEFRDIGRQPSPRAVERTTGQLIAAIAEDRFADQAGPMSAALWRDGESTLPDLDGDGALATARPPVAAAWPQVDSSAARAHVAAAQALRQQLGHYLGATLYYQGEWYWGIDRLHHLERRLQELGAQRPGVEGPMFAPDADLQRVRALAAPPAIDFFFSLRSPYSAIVAPRVFELGRLTGTEVKLRYVLPMVMRGLPVPAEKRRYISLDAAREAHLRGIAFGRVNDPVGRPAERGLSLIPLAEQQELGPAYVLSFMRGVWAEGIDAGSDRGLRRIAERAGLDWRDALDALADTGWRSTAERNREELFSLGLWGVPSFRVGDVAVWGQDRLWAVQEALLGPYFGVTL